MRSRAASARLCSTGSILVPSYRVVWRQHSKMPGVWTPSICAPAAHRAARPQRHKVWTRANGTRGALGSVSGIRRRPDGELHDPSLVDVVHARRYSLLLRCTCNLFRNELAARPCPGDHPIILRYILPTSRDHMHALPEISMLARCAQVHVSAGRTSIHTDLQQPAYMT